MTISESISALILNEIDKEELYLKVGTATNIDVQNSTFTFTPNDLTAVVNDVLLKTIESESGGSFVIVPSNGSQVTIAFTSPTTGICIDVEVAQEIKIVSELTTFNDGDNGGLVNINDLTNSLNSLVSSVNSLVQAYNTHAHTANGTSPPTILASNANNFNSSDYEDDTVIH